MDYDKLFNDTIMTMMSIQASIKERSTQLSLVKGENGVLMYLFFNEKPIAINKVADYFDLSSGRISNVILSLEKKGLINRRASLEDKREKYLSLTDSGKEYAKKLKAGFCKGIEYVISKIGEKEYYEFLQKLVLIAKIVNYTGEENNNV